MALDILGILKKYQVPHTIQRSRNWVVLACPFCRDGHDDHGGFNLSSAIFSCWVCGSNSPERALRALLGLSWEEIEALVFEFSGRKNIYAKLNTKKQNASSIDLIGGPLQSIHREYLTTRKFVPSQLVRKYKLVGTLQRKDEWKYRIIIPIFYNKKLVAYQGRDITGRAFASYMTTSNTASVVDPKRILFNLDNCQRDSLIVVEGAFDAMRGGDDVAALLGIGFTPAQVNLIAARFRRALIVFDPEVKAQKRAKKLAACLSSLGVSTSVIDTELPHDPGDMSDAEWKTVKDYL